MSFISPMLASPMPVNFNIKPEEWSSEEKFDGHRLILEVSDIKNDLLSEGKGVRAWSRNGLSRVLPRHIVDACGKLPNGVYDGELLVIGKRSYGVTELTNTSLLTFMCFDVLVLLDQETQSHTYKHRRAYLEEIFSRPEIESKALQLAKSTVLESLDEVITLRDEVWQRDGEGLILKRRDGIYIPGKRSKDFIKVKMLRTAVLRVIGFAESKGQIQNRGQYATVILQDDDGNTTTVKTRNDAELKKLEAAGKTTLGRLLRIEYQERTPSGQYRHPRWDRWENE